MQIDFEILPKILGYVVLFLTVYYALYKRFLYSLIDPLFVWISTTAFSSVLVLEVLTDARDIVHFFASQFFLWFGFYIANKMYVTDIQNKKGNEHQFTFTDFNALLTTTYILLFIYILSNTFVGYSKGFALFSEAPTESKIANFQNGFGIFRKISWSAGTFVSTSFIFLYLVYRKKAHLVCLFIVVFFSSLEGSKSAILQIAISAGIVIYHPFFFNHTKIISTFKSYIPFILLLALFVFFVVLFKENSSRDEIVFAFIRRLLYSADSVLYYYLPVNIDHFQKYNFFDFIHRIVNPVLGFLRLQPYMEAPGNIMVDNLKVNGVNDGVTIGPNTPFYIEGRIYFNYWLSFIYCILLGFTFSLIRIKFFLLKKSSAFFFVFFASFVHFSSSLIIDINLAITQFFDLMFFVLPFYLLSLIVLKRTIKITISRKWIFTFLIPQK